MKFIVWHQCHFRGYRYTAPLVGPRSRRRAPAVICRHADGLVPEIAVAAERGAMRMRTRSDPAPPAVLDKRFGPSWEHRERSERPRVWMPLLMQAVFVGLGHAIGCGRVSGLVLRPRTPPRARMEMCGSRPYRVCALEAPGAVQAARDPVSSTDVPCPSSTSRIAGPPAGRLAYAATGSL